MENRIFGYKMSTNVSTGGDDHLAQSRLVEFPFDKYVVKIRVSSRNEIIGIEEIVVNKDFLSYNERLQVLSRQGYHDVEEFYKKDEDQ